MCVGGGGGGASGQPDHTKFEEERPNRDSMFANSDVYSEGTIGGSGWSQHKGGKKSHWSSNPTWDKQWTDQGYTAGDSVNSTSKGKQSDKTFGG